MSVELKEKGRWDPLKVFLKVSAAYLLSFFTKKKSGKKIALVGGNLGEKYEDNAAVYHKYLLNNHKEQVTAYWMYDSKTSYAKDQKIENAVPLGSFKNYLLFFQADYTFHGHSLLYDIVPSADKFLFLNRKTIITHVSHGIEGFKKILIQKEDVPLLKRTDYFNCASQYEYELKLNKWKIPEKKLILTGFPRFDRYPPNQPSKEVKNILMMMTWREWLFDLTKEEFIESPYFKNTTGLLKHQGIQQLLTDHNLHLNIALHPFMKKFESYFTGLTDNEHGIKFLDFNQETIEYSIDHNDMLLTDITSVSWDFLYLNKPIIFYMFDQQEYLEKRGTYLNLDSDLYGYKADSIDHVYEYLKKIIEEKITYNEWYPKASDYIDYFDQDNCKRLTERVMGL
ncbi:CDP-glycerol glycerophosphotransferase family protein [Microbacterium sp. APC 3898]|uniref:CDP-glycerol glycerophosphotransferase family protein n=2 Tax=Planococcus TaxID=1372 RepID=A0ABT7ZK94_9BACL|nr:MULTISPECIES: CDP-glycerol glycerophosphotransferase family protein [Terrabacteria group]MBD8014667.1 CDP-glycerol glycerophosphotransferase family protein [Planococcus wigleyi]MDN3427538.1 CDP-glycerol glycerophosphotransferase family protein [Planococcus sp. APC 4016]MDN3499089.1 CDP-glycerol glycerophosphotransferase family protein [Microbacterium sp. APC 3898]